MVPPIFHWIFSLWNTGQTLPRFPIEFSKHNGLFIPSLKKGIYGITSFFSQSKYLHLDDTQNLKSLKQRINTSQSIPLFLLFQEHSTITKVTEVIEEIFKVNTNENIEDMDNCDFT